MSSAPNNQVDLVKLFSSVSTVLQENQQSLDAADPYNHNHGDNMVDNFQVITQALKQKKGALPSDQLAYASQVLSQKSQSGSAQLYAEGLSRASDQLRGQSIITAENAMLLVQALMGGQSTAPQQATEPPPDASGLDLLSGLLGGQASSSQGQPSGENMLSGLFNGQGSVAQDQPAGGDLLGGLLNTFMGNAPADQADHAQAAPAGGGIDLNTLLGAGMAFFQARQHGAAPTAALVQAVMAGSQMYNSQHHSQSGQLVAETLLNTISSMLSARR